MLLSLIKACGFHFMQISELQKSLHFRETRYNTDPEFQFFIQKLELRSLFSCLLYINQCFDLLKVGSYHLVPREHPTEGQI